MVSLPRRQWGLQPGCCLDLEGQLDPGLKGTLEGEDGHRGSGGGKEAREGGWELDRVSATSIRWRKGEGKLVAGWASLALELCAGTRGHAQKGACAWCHALLSLS